MSELDVLTVRLEADVTQFQQQLDRAKTQLSTFGTATRPAEQGIAKVGTSATKAVPGLNRLNGAFLALARQATGTSPALGQLAGALGAFSISAGPLAAILAGTAAVAIAFKLITQEARETKKEVDAAISSIQELSAQELPSELRDIGQITANLAPLREELSKVQGGIAQREGLGIDNTELRDLKIREEQLLASITKGKTAINRLQLEVGGIQLDAVEAVADSMETAAKKSAAAWRKVVSEIEEAVRAHHATFEGVALPGLASNKPGGPTAAETMGFVFPPGFHTNIDNTASALKNLQTELDKAGKVANTYRGEIITGSGEDWRGGGGGGGFIKGIGSMLMSSFGPLALLGNALADSFQQLAPIMEMFSTIISAALTPILEALFPILKQVALGFTYVAQFAFNLAGGLLIVLGTIQKGVGWFLEAIAKFVNKIIPFADPLKPMEKLGQAMQTVGQGMLDLGHGFIDAASAMPGVREEIRGMTLGASDFADSINDATDSMRNIPAGFKVNLAQYNATSTGGASSFDWDKTKRDRVPVVRLVLDSAGVLSVVENQATRKIRSGGTLAWEVAG